MIELENKTDGTGNTSKTDVQYKLDMLKKKKFKKEMKEPIRMALYIFNNKDFYKL